MTEDLLDKPLVIAIVEGKELTRIPEDLFIPPDALEVLLDSFSGPLDVLLYLIRKQNLDILNIPILSITEQYLQYIKLMQCRKLELAADYLLMAAMLAEIKSRLLLPARHVEEEDEEEDPRMALVRRLQAYEQMKYAAELIDALPRNERDFFVAQVRPEACEVIRVYPDLALEELVEAFKSLLVKEGHKTHHPISRELLSVRDRMTLILERLQNQTVLEFTRLFELEEGRMGLIVSLLAILELARQSLLVITQNDSFSNIYVQAA